MKRLLFPLFLLFPIALSGQTAKIKIDIDRTIAEIDPKIYGVFMEPIQFTGKEQGLPETASLNTLYGSLYDPASPLADENGFRTDYIEAMKELKITNMRWPGGNYAMGYNWQDGIGPKNKRPARINLGLGTIDDARYWVEYSNYSKGTYYSDLRAKNGHEQPYNIKIWDLGNEVDGAPWELGHKSAEDYVKIAREAAKAMKSVDDTIQFVASGSSYYESSGGWVEWNRKVLAALGDLITYISVHRYWENSPDYYAYMGQSAMDFEEKIRVTAAEIDAMRVMKGFRNPIYISFDEWGVIGRDFLSVLPVAQSLNSFIRHADTVKMSNFTMLTTLLSSDKMKGTYKTPLFNIYKLFSNNCRGNSIDTYVESETFDTEKYKAIPYLDVTAVYSRENNAVYINVVNRHRDKSITADIISSSGNLEGKAEASLVANESLTEPFTYDKRERYVPTTREIQVEGNHISYSFPAHSFTQIKVGVKK